MSPMRAWKSIGAVLAIVSGAVADQPALLNVDTSCLTASGAAPGAQPLNLSAAYRGVTAGGAARVASPFGWQLNADQSAVDEIASRHLGPVDLLTGAVNYAEQQLVLPAVAPWPIGVSFNNAQGSTVDGLQGRNWFQNSQPCVSAPDSSNVVRLFYAADAFVEYHQIDESHYYAGVNGAGGVLSIENATEGEHLVQLYVLHDQGGNEIVFFGHSGVPDGASGQIWKYMVAKGAKSSEPDVAAYVGNATLPYTAAHDGYENGHIVAAFDSVGRKYRYTYVTIGGVERLTQVEAVSAGGSPATIATVEYSYYDTAASAGGVGNTTTNNGSNGDLAMIRVTLPTSFGASGSDPAILDVRENRFYYDGSSRLKLVLGYEGTRRHLVNTAGSPVNWDANSTTLATALNSLAELRIVYEGSSPYRVASLWFDGMDGSGSNPAGQYDVTYEHTAYSTPWSDRTVVKLPAFARFGGTTLSGASETTDSSWSTQYFDDIGQPLSSVVTSEDPSTTSSPHAWITGIERDSTRRLIAINTPANCSGYTNHNATTSARGTFTRSATDGLVTYFEREGTVAARTGLVKAVRRGVGTGTAYASTNYVTYTTLALQAQTISASSPVVEVRKPIATATRVYPVATTAASTSSAYNETTYDYDWWNGTLVPRWVKTSLPAIAVANNGVNAADIRRTWYSHLGQAIVTQLPNKRLDISEYDATTGLLARQTTDSSTPTSSFAHYSDLPTAPGDAPAESTIAQEANPYNVVTEYSYDALGRSSQTLSNPGSDFEHGRHVTRSYYTRLSDRRLVRLDVPAVDDASTPVYCGPVSAAVINHSGLVEEAGQISPSDPTVRASTDPSRFTTTAAPRTWLAAPSSTIADDCLPKAQHNGTAGGGAALVSYALSLTSPDGSRVLESRRYTSIPTSGTTAADFRGTANTDGNNHHFDYTLARYNALGMVDRTEDFTRTIEHTTFDVLGRPVQHSRGTVDSGTTPAPNMRVYSSIVYDATNYGTYTSGNLNVPGGNSNVTQVFQHPGGAFNGGDDIHSFMRYDGLGNATNVWRDGGPFLASSVDNLDRVKAAAAFNGSVSSWNSTAVDITSMPIPAGMTNLLRYAQANYDERGRTFRRSVFAVNPSSGAMSSTAGDTTTLDTFWGANNVVKAQTGATTQMTARDRLCRPKTGFVTVTTAGNESQSDHNGELIAANPANSIVVQQTNIYRVPNSGQIVCTTRAERGTTDIINTTGGPAIDSSTVVPTFGALMDIPGNPVPTTNPPCLQIAYDPSISPYVGLGMRSGHAASNLLLDVRTYEFDALMMVPLKRYMLGDVLRHPIPPTQICCGIISTSSGGCGTPFPGVTGLPFIEEDTEFDPRRAVCRAVTTDWETGERTTVARLFNAAGQPLHTMRARSNVSPVISPLPDGGTPLTPESGPGCCGETERTDNEWDKGRIKLERMFLCDPPSNPELFNPLTEGNWSGCSNSCPKTTSFGYPDYAPDTTGSGGGGFYPWNAPDAPTQTPNDNNLLLWSVRPIGGQPDINWHAGRSDGGDDADWYTYDYLGRPTRSYLFPFRKTTFGDGNAAPDAPARHTFYGAGGYPMDWRTPSGDHLNPWDHVNVDRDGLGRPTQMRHFLGVFSPSSTPTPNDAIDFGYDRFGMLGSYGQSFDGMFPSGCGGSGPLTCNLVREGTPQEKVTLGGRDLQPWRGPRMVRQTLPVPNMEVGMAYFPNPSTGYDDTTMYPGGGGGGYMPQLVEPRLNWALGRPTGIYQGDGTNHYDTPLTQYDYVGMAVPLYRSMLLAGGSGMDEWPGLPTSYAPVGNPGGSTPMKPIPNEGIDWRHRTRTDVWRPGIDSQPSSIASSKYGLLLEAEGPKSIVWAGSHLISMLDPATSPDFNGAGGSSPVSNFDINGHDEYTRYDCNWRPIYWLSGQLVGKGKSPTAAGPYQDAQTAWLHGLSSPTGVNSAALKPGAGVSGAAAISEVEMRWPSSPTGCGSSGGASGWLMAPSGLVNTAHPLSPNYGSGGAGADEWGQHAGTPTTEGCDPAGINSRTVTEGRRMTSGTSEVNYAPPGGTSHYPREFSYDAAGNVSFDGRHYYQYDGGNRLKDVYDVAWSGGGGSSPSLGLHYAHFDYDGLGRLSRSQYDTDGDGSLSDEDTEWTPRDHLGRPIGIWRQSPTSGACAKPYQVFAYHNTSFRGEGSDDSRGILDAPAVRWRDTSGGGGDLTEVVSYLQDFRGDVRAVVSPSSGILERDRYGLTGRPEAFPASDVNFDGKVDTDDYDDFSQAKKQFGNSAADYDPRADLDRDGDVDDDDETLFNASYGDYAGYSGQWKLSAGEGLSPGVSGDKAGLDNRFGWRGYWYDSHLQVYHVRNRAYDPRQGQFLQTDPLGFSAGDQNLYRYADGNFSSGYDPTGLLGDAVPWNPEPGEFTALWNDQGCSCEGAIQFDQIASDSLIASRGGRGGFVEGALDATNVRNWTWDGFWGGVQMVGGTFEVAGGFAFAVGTSWTGVGILGGGVIMAHGIDNIQAGARQMWTGQPVETVTHYALQASLERYTGASPEAASRGATFGDAALGFLGVNPFSIGRGLILAGEELGAVLARALGGGGRLMPATGEIVQAGGAIARAGGHGDQSAAFAAGLLKCETEVAKNRERGLAAERLVPGEKNTARIPAPSGGAQYRVPDRLNRATRIIGEIKDVGYQYWSSQLSDSLAFAKNNGYRFELWLRHDTEVSEELARMIREGRVVRMTIPGR